MIDFWSCEWAAFSIVEILLFRITVMRMKNEKGEARSLKAKFQLCTVNSELLKVKWRLYRCVQLKWWHSSMNVSYLSLSNTISLLMISVNVLLAIIWKENLWHFIAISIFVLLNAHRSGHMECHLKFSFHAITEKYAILPSNHLIKRNYYLSVCSE